MPVKIGDPVPLGAALAGKTLGGGLPVEAASTYQRIAGQALDSAANYAAGDQAQLLLGLVEMRASIDNEVAKLTQVVLPGSPKPKPIDP